MNLNQLPHASSRETDGGVQTERPTMRRLDVATAHGTVLNGALFPAARADTVVIAITGVHGNFYSNPFYFNIGQTLSTAGTDFIYAPTRDAFNRVDSVNVTTGQPEQIGSFDEDFGQALDDIAAYLDYAEAAGYQHIILAGHSLGANKVIYYLAHTADPRVEKFLLLSPANINHMTSVVTDDERQLVEQFVATGRGRDLLPFPLLGWLPCLADTAYQWLSTDTLDNVHVETDGDFSQVSAIRHSGALIIGTLDRFTYGDPARFLSNINDHMARPAGNRLVFIQETGHTYQRQEQALADAILGLVRSWQTDAEEH